MKRSRYWNIIVWSFHYHKFSSLLERFLSVCIEKELWIDAIYTDTRKAFDTVNNPCTLI